MPSPDSRIRRLQGLHIDDASLIGERKDEGDQAGWLAFVEAAPVHKPIFFVKQLLQADNTAA